MPITREYAKGMFFMAKKQFKAESKRLLDLMINSIYTNKEIFLRELISNASDALDKLWFRSLTDGGSDVSREDLVIRLTPDVEAGTLKISDNGCGMTKDELENNLGVIAKSGTLEFKKDNPDADVNVIGQFGVGFYSAFMVADKVSVLTKAYGSDEAWLWESEGVDGYTIVPAEKASYGTEITLKMKEDTEEEDYCRFLEEWTIKQLVKKYSDYVPHPIKMVCKKTKYDEKGENPTIETTDETLNSMTPVWKKKKEDTTDEELYGFYKDKFFDFEAPAHVIRTTAEGLVSYDALLFIPSRTPFDYYSKDYKKGITLYSDGVMIMENCAELLPDYFGFVKGVVDSSDLSLNISRETLQKDAQLKTVAAGLKKKIRSELMSILEDDREKYEKIFKNFGLSLKYGVYENYGAEKDQLSDLLLFATADKEKPVTLKEYVEAMPEGQKYIYYACGESKERIISLPQSELVRSKGYDVLCLTDRVDEFAIKMLHKYNEKEFRSVSDKDTGIEAEKKEESEKYNDLLEAVKKALGDKVKKVVVSDKLVKSPVCLSSDNEISIEMEKVLAGMPGADKDAPKAEKVLELNASHPLFAALEKAKDDEKRLSKLAAVLYGEALISEGLTLDDPAAFNDAITDLLTDL